MSNDAALCEKMLYIIIYRLLTKHKLAVRIPWLLRLESVRIANITNGICPHTVYGVLSYYRGQCTLATMVENLNCRIFSHLKLCSVHTQICNNQYRKIS